MGVNTKAPPVPTGTATAPSAPRWDQMSVHPQTTMALTRQPPYFSAMQPQRSRVAPEYANTDMNHRRSTTLESTTSTTNKAAIAGIESVMNDDNDNLGFGLKQKAPLPKIKKKFPFFVPVLSIAQVALLVVTIVAGGLEKVWINPMIGPSQETLIAFGGKISTRVRPPHWEVWRLLTAFMLHSGVIHIVLNMLWQLNMVLRVELYWGGFRVGPIYVLSGVAGNLLSCIFLPDSVSIGATCCLIGLMGALLADIFINWTVLQAPLKNVLGLCVQLFLFAVIGLIPFVDNFSHVGGFFVGFLSGLVLVPRIVPVTQMKKKGKKSSTTAMGKVRAFFNRDKAIMFEEGTAVNEVEPGGMDGEGLGAGTSKRQQERMAKLKKKRRRLNIFYAAVRVVALLLLIVYFLIGFALLFFVDDLDCEWCQWLNPTWDMLFAGIE